MGGHSPLTSRHTLNAPSPPAPITLRTRGTGHAQRPWHCHEGRSPNRRPQPTQPDPGRSGGRPPAASGGAWEDPGRAHAAPPGQLSQRRRRNLSALAGVGRLPLKICNKKKKRKKPNTSNWLNARGGTETPPACPRRPPRRAPRRRAACLYLVYSRSPFTNHTALRYQDMVVVPAPPQRCWRRLSPYIRRPARPSPARPPLSKGRGAGPPCFARRRHYGLAAGAGCEGG